MSEKGNPDTSTIILPFRRDEGWESDKRQELQDSCVRNALTLLPGNYMDHLPIFALGLGFLHSQPTSTLAE